MIVKINGVALEQPKVEVAPILESIEPKLEKVGKHLMPISIGLGALNMSKIAMAAGGAVGLADKIMPLIHLLQDFALPVGIGVATWGLIEVMIGNPAGKQKIKSAVIGYVGIFILPTVFYEIRAAFR